MTRDEARELWERCKANIARLEGCPGPHRFVIIPSEPVTIIARSRCETCRGEVSASDRRWYERGLAHGRAGSGS